MSKGPLSGLRVLEFGQIAAGPFSGMLLADLGADVVKVERPDTGDGMRGWPPLMQNVKSGERFSGGFAALNRNKRSIAIDLKDATSHNRLRALCDHADIIVENFRPGVLSRLQLGYETLALTNSHLVYCSLSGYGQIGPYAQKGAFDVTIQAISGVMSVTGEPDGPPAKCGVPLSDFVAGLYAGYAIMAAVHEARQTGVGTHIDCSMLGAVLGIAALQHSEYFCTSVPPRRLGSAHPQNAPYQAFEAADGSFVVAAGNQELWHKLCEVIGQPGVEVDPRFITQELRAKNQRQLAERLQSIFALRSRTEWLSSFDARGIPCAPVNDFKAIFEDSHVEAMGLVHELLLPNGVRMKTVGFPVSMTGYAFGIERPPPALGEHTEEVFQEWLGAEELLGAANS
jgi:crotonobetainyl-CoA:carnitine CoA-transferase CaiB-like acyl-CoA transferase